MSEWKTVKAQEHWIDLEDPEGWYSAGVKWDGCIHFNRYYNAPLSNKEYHKDGANMDYIHICDIDEYIERLKKLKEAAIKHFGAGWPIL